MKTLISLLTSLLLCLPGFAELRIVWSSEILVPGESVTMYLIQESGDTFSIKNMPEVKNGRIRVTQQGFLRRSAQKSRAYVTILECVPYKEGNLEIPAFTVHMDAGYAEKTVAQSIPVVSFDKIQWLPLSSAGDINSFGIMYHASSQSPYVNESTKCELKFYLNQKLSSPNVPLMRSDGVAMSRFLPVLAEELQSVELSGTALLEGKTWNVFSFSSQISPLKSGLVSIGPGTADTNARLQKISPQRGQIFDELITVPLNIPEYSLSAAPLPAGAPPNYQNAVGVFEVATETTATDITEGEPVSVTITIKGKGNLHVLPCPRPDDEENWKLYPPNKITPTQQNFLPSEQDDSVVFQLLMKPLRKVDEIPSFSLPYFVPATGSYAVARSKAIPLKWKAVSPASTAAAQMPPPPAGIVPVEEMGDILATADSIPGFPVSLSSFLASHRLWPWMVTPAFLLILWGLYIRIRNYKLSTKDVSDKTRRLSQIAGERDSLNFLRSLGSFIESEIPENKRTPEILEILKERDNLAFQPDKASYSLEQNTRTSWLKTVRSSLKALSIVLLLSLCSLQLSHGEEDPLSSASTAFLAGDYEVSSQLLGEMNPDKMTGSEKAQYYYLRGNVAYKQGKPGIAALDYRRALLYAPDHFEARRNLAFIERKEGALKHATSSTGEVLATIGFSWYYALFLGALAAVTCIGAYMWAFRRKSISLWFGFWVAFFFLAGSLWAMLFYPADTNPLCVKDQFVITGKDASSWHAASKTSNKVFTKLPPSTLCKVLKDTGTWLYVEFPSNSRGWILSTSGEYLVPNKADIPSS